MLVFVAAFVVAIKETRIGAHNFTLPDGFEILLVDGTWDEVLEALRKEASGQDLRPGWVRSDFLVAEVDGVPVGAEPLDPVLAVVRGDTAQDRVDQPGHPPAWDV